MNVCPAGSNYREPVRYDALRKCIWHAEVARRQSEEGNLLISLRLVHPLRCTMCARADFRYIANVEDCNVKSNECELGESAEGVISASYRRKSESVVNYNGLL